jgi:hypothetical protein
METKVKVEALAVFLLAFSMTVAAPACRATAGPSQEEPPMATPEFEPTAEAFGAKPSEASVGPDPAALERTEIAEFGPTSGPLTFAPAGLPAARVGVIYEEKISILGNVTPVDSFYLADGALPSGLELVPLEGEDAALISGIPTRPETSTFKISVTCFGTQVSGQSGDREYTLDVEN